MMRALGAETQTGVIASGNIAQAGQIVNGVARLNHSLPFPYAPARSGVEPIDPREALLLRDRRKVTKAKARHEAELEYESPDNKAWDVFGSPLSDYWKDLLHIEDMEDFPTAAEEALAEIATLGERPGSLALDIGAAGRAAFDFVESLGFSDAASVTLSFGANDNLRSQKGLIHGNIMSRKTLRALDVFLEERGRDGFEVIVSRMEGGLRYLPLGSAIPKYASDPAYAEERGRAEMKMAFWLLDQAYQRMASSGAVGLLQVADLQALALSEYGDELRSEGILVGEGPTMGTFNTIKLRRWRGGPSQLPVPKI